MLKQLLNFIRRIFQSTSENHKHSVDTNILGPSYTDLYEYGVICNVIGDSLTNLNDYVMYTSNVVNNPINSDNSEDVIVDDFETFSLNDVADDNPDLEEETVSLTINSIQSDDFEHLEIMLNNQKDDDFNSIVNVSDTLGKLKGSHLYESLQNNEGIRNKVTQLLDRVSQDNSKEDNAEVSLLDMSEFLNTK